MNSFTIRLATVSAVLMVIGVMALEVVGWVATLLWS